MVCSCLGSVGDSGKIQCSPELSTSRTIWHFGREIGHKKKRVLFTFGLCMGWVSGGGEQESNLPEEGGAILPCWIGKQV